MNFENNQIYIIKLSTGEELIAKIIDATLDKRAIIVDQPISTVISPQGLQMVPSLFSANTEQPVTINTDACVMLAEPREDVKNSYIQATTGIVPVSKKILTG